jgi:tetratricopeptide (TPR) repeat protein
MERGKKEEARKWATDAIIKTDGLVTAYLTRVLIDLERYEKLRHDRGGGVRPETTEAKLLEQQIRNDLAVVEKNYTEAADLIYARGLLHFAQGRFLEAAREIEKYLEKVPGDWRARNWCAHAYMHTDLHEKTIEMSRRTLEDRPRYSTCYIYIGYALAMQGKLEEAIDAYSEALKIRSKSEEAWLNRGIARRNLGRKTGRRELLVEAEEDMTRALEIEPDLAEGYASRAVTRIMLGNRSGALEDCERTIKLAPSSAKGYRMRGLVHLSSRDFEAAIKDLSRAIELDPDVPEDYHNRGYACHLESRLHEAIADYDRAEAKGLSHPGLFYKRGSAHEELGRDEEALADYGRAIEVNGRYGPAYAGRGMIRFRREEWKGAADDLKFWLDNTNRYQRSYVCPLHEESKAREMLRAARDRSDPDGSR